MVLVTSTLLKDCNAWMARAGRVADCAKSGLVEIGIISPARYPTEIRLLAAGRGQFSGDRQHRCMMHAEDLADRSGAFTRF